MCVNRKSRGNTRVDEEQALVQVHVDEYVAVTVLGERTLIALRDW